MECCKSYKILDVVHFARSVHEQNHLHAPLVACATSVYDTYCLGYWKRK